MPSTPDLPLAPARLLELLRAYLDAEYRWEFDRRWHTLTIGTPAPGLDEAFPDAGRFALLSAWNPHSKPRPEQVNRAEDHDLHTRLQASGLPFQPGFSSAKNRSWREPSWVVVDMPVAEIDALARRFGQLGVLCWGHGQPVRLRMYARKPGGWPEPGDPHGDSVDWIE